MHADAEGLVVPVDAGPGGGFAAPAPNPPINDSAEWLSRLSRSVRPTDQRLRILDLHAPAVQADQPGRFGPAKHLVSRRPSGASKAGEGLLGERDDGARRAVAVQVAQCDDVPQQTFLHWHVESFDEALVELTDVYGQQVYEKAFDAGKLLPQSRELIPGEHEGLDRIQRGDSGRAQAIVRQQGQFAERGARAEDGQDSRVSHGRGDADADVTGDEEV